MTHYPKKIKFTRLTALDIVPDELYIIGEHIVKIKTTESPGWLRGVTEVFIDSFSPNRAYCYGVDVISGASIQIPLTRVGDTFAFVNQGYCTLKKLEEVRDHLIEEVTSEINSLNKRVAHYTNFLEVLNKSKE